MNTTQLVARTRACALLASAALGALVPGLACAETKLVNVPAEKFLIAPGGVDMRTGRYVYSATDLSIGGGQDGGLALTRTMSNYVANHANPFGNFSHNWDIMLLETRVDLAAAKPVGNDYRMNVHAGGRSFTFESNQSSGGYAFKSDGPIAYLTFSGGTKGDASTIYNLAAPDGTSMIFRPIGGEDCADQNWGSATWGGGRRRCAFISEMTQPDGTRYSFDYASTGRATGNRVRLKQVTSSRGYALLLEGSDTSISKACVVNLSTNPLALAGQCPSSASAVSTYSYSTDGKLTSITGPDGSVTGFSYSLSGTNGTNMAFIKPGLPTPWLTNELVLMADEEEALQEIVRTQTFSDGQSYSYTFDLTPATNNKPNRTIAGGSFTDAAGRRTIVKYGFPVLPGTGPSTPCTQAPCPIVKAGDFNNDNSTFQQTPGPVKIIDALNRITINDYCDPVAMAGLPPRQLDRCFVFPLYSFTDPDGIKTSLEYDSSLNVTKVIRKSKTAGLSDIITSAAYDTTHPKSATKPLWIRDANGNQTDYTYAPEHGGLLTETGPAVNGVRPQTRNTYVQRAGWTLNNGSFVQSGPPVWLLASTSMCKTGSASGNGCVVSGDEVVTTYDYGPDSGPNNLLLRGVVEDTGGLNLRTCYAYDAIGNKISETRPKAGLTSCP